MRARLFLFCVTTLPYAASLIENNINSAESLILGASKSMDDVFERVPLGKLSPGCQESCDIPNSGCGKYYTVPLNTSIDADMSDKELKRLARSLHWVHDVELRPGISTKKNSRDPSAVWEQSHIVNTFPDVKGKAVLELGSWNGKWGFMAEERGAAHVTMTDFVCWGRGPLCNERQKWLADPNYPYTPAAELCGMRAPFDLARAVRKSKVTAIEIDPFDVSKRNLGRCFDVVLYPGILYHVFNQEAQLSRLYDVLCEGGTIYVEGPDSGTTSKLAKFSCATEHCNSNEVPWGAFVTYEVAGNNKWFMSVKGVTDMLTAMGFANVQVLHTGGRAVHTAQRLIKQTCLYQDCTDAAHPARAQRLAHGAAAKSRVGQ